MPVNIEDLENINSPLDSTKKVLNHFLFMKVFFS